MILKEELYTACLKFIDNRLTTVKSTIADLQNSLQSETKSSAGDKHETGRAMLQLEREKAGHQLAEIEKQQQILQKVNMEVKHHKVALGSVVQTTQSNYFISVSAGEIIIDNITYFAISTATPMAQLLMSKTVGDEISFRDNTFKIVMVL